jgi:hypothetical protein
MTTPLTTPRCTLCDTLVAPSLLTDQMCPKCLKAWKREGEERRFFMAMEMANAAPTIEWVEAHFNLDPVTSVGVHFDDATADLAEKYDEVFNASKYTDELDDCGIVNEHGATYFLNDTSVVVITTDMKLHHYPRPVNQD